MMKIADEEADKLKMGKEPKTNKKFKKAKKAIRTDMEQYDVQSVIDQILG